MKTRALLGGILLIGFPAGWAIGDNYYIEMRKQGHWILRGEGALWDSAWALRHIRAVEVESPSEWIWTVYQALRTEKAFEELHFSYTGQGNGKIYARTREPVARVSLPLRQYYVDAHGERLPFVLPLDLPIIEASRWDSIAISEILNFWSKNRIYHLMTARIYQDSRGVWKVYTETSSETFVLGRTEHLPTAFAQLDVYLRSLQPQIGGHACKSVLLYIPDQIVCQ